MGIFRAVNESIKGVLHEQWKEFFACDSLSNDTLMLRVKKHVSARSANADPNDEIVSNGSIVSVADGQSAIVVSQGRVLASYDAPGAHRFLDPDRPKGLAGFFHDVKERIAFGGSVQPVRHRVYVVNTKECHGNRFDTPAPVPVRITDSVTGMDIDLSVSAGGMYAYRVTDPAALYHAVGNIEGRCDRSYLKPQLDAELLSALAPAIAAIVKDGVRPYALPGYAGTLGAAVTDAVKEPFLKRFGITLLSIAFDKLVVEEAWMVQNGQRAAILKDPAMAAATMIDATAQALLSVSDAKQEK